MVPSTVSRSELAVLIVEDSPDDFDLLCARLTGVGLPVTTRRVETAEELTAALNERGWDAVVSDHRLPTLSSLDALGIVRAQDRNLPFLIVSGSIGEESAVAAMQAGADDYVMKEKLGRFVPALQRALEAATLRGREREAATALAQSESRFRALTANLPGIVLQFEWRHEILSFHYISEGVRRLLGLDPAILVQDPARFIACMTAQQAHSLHDRLRDAAQRGGDLRWSGHLQRADDARSVWIEVAASQREVQPGQTLWDGIATDITAQKQAEEALRTSREDLRTLTSHLARVREQEREDIARELHDDVGSTLTALKFELSFARNALKSQPDALPPIKRADELVDSAILVSTRIMHDLRPGILDEGLVAALEWQARTFEQRMGIVCNFSSTHTDIPLSHEQSMALFRICQEALNNVAKYAGATAVNVRLRANDGRLALEVCDDGCGISLADLAKSDRFGLRGMRERAYSLGGTVDIDGREGRGTTITVVLPLAGPSAEATVEVEAQ